MTEYAAYVISDGNVKIHGPFTDVNKFIAYVMIKWKQNEDTCTIREIPNKKKQKQFGIGFMEKIIILRNDRMGTMKIRICKMSKAGCK